MRFRGRSQHSVDDKGRISLPAKQRKALPEEVVVVPGFGKALCVFSEEAFDAWVDSFFPEGYDITDSRQRAIHDKLFENAENVTIDSAGRIKLAPVQRKWAGIEKNVVVTGNDDHLEIKASSGEEEEEKKALDFSLEDLLNG